MEPAATESTPRPIKLRLCVMMFLQYFVQGCFLPIAPLYAEYGLGFSADEVGILIGALSIGSILAPLVIGQMVDRHLPTQYVLAGCHMLAGIVMLAIYTQRDFKIVVGLATLYSLLFIPTLMLTNSLAFHHMKNRERDFPVIRVWGTLGFVTAAWLIELVLLRGLTGRALYEGRGVAFALAGAVGLLMGLYSLTLPATPPQKQSGTRFAPALVFGLLRQRHFLVLVVVTFGIAIVHTAYFSWNTPFLKNILSSGSVTAPWEQRIAALGQICEIAVMFSLSALIARLGFKTIMVIGAAAYTLRCLVFALAWHLGSPFELVMSLAAFGNCLHAVCFGCFLAVAFMYVDRVSKPDVRGSMQNLFGNFLFGLGALVGGAASGGVKQWFAIASEGEIVYDWVNIWLSCAALAALCLFVFAAFFPARERIQTT
jgi:nucleoside transporter